MKTRLTLDRFEGRDKEIAVLVLAIDRDVKATRRIADETRSIQEELKGRDPGGDLTL